MANALRAWALFPDEYAQLRADPKLLRNAFDESLRWDSPSRMAGRIALPTMERADIPPCHPAARAARTALAALSRPGFLPVLANVPRSSSPHTSNAAAGYFAASARATCTRLPASKATATG